MTVYVLMGCVDYEGDNIISVFRHKESVVNYVNNVFGGYWIDDCTYKVLDFTSIYDGLYISEEEVFD